MQFYRKIISHIRHGVSIICCEYRFVTYVRPCATCIHYANNEPRGIEVCMHVLDTMCIFKLRYIVHVVFRNNNSIPDCILCSIVAV